MKKKICAFVFVSVLGFASICPAPMLDIPGPGGGKVRKVSSSTMTVSKDKTTMTIFVAWFVRTFDFKK